MRVAIAIAAALTICTASSNHTLLLYKDSSFSDYIGLLGFDLMDQCYELCVDEDTAAFAWNGNSIVGQFVFFENGQCLGMSIAGSKVGIGELSVVVTGGKHILKSFILTTKGRLEEPSRLAISTATSSTSCTTTP